MPAAERPDGATPTRRRILAAGRAYVANGLSNDVSVIDLGTDTVTATIPVGSAPVDIAVNPAATEAYVTNSGADTVSVIDLATNAVTATIPVGSFPGGVTTTATRVYVTNGSSDDVTVLDQCTTV